MFSRLKWFSYYNTRKLEYSVSVQAIGFGIFLLLPPASLEASAGAVAAAELTREANWGALFLGFGAASAYALHVNGKAAWTPFVRMGAMMALIITLAFFSHGYLPWSPAAYWFLSSAFLLFGNGLLSASRDAGQEVRRWRQEKEDGP